MAIMFGESLEETRNRVGEDVHGFVLMLAGALPEDKERAQDILGRIITAVDKTLRDFSAEGLALGTMTARMEPYAAYIEKRMPNATR